MELPSIFLIVLNSLQFVKPGNADNGKHFTHLFVCKNVKK